MIPEPTIPIRLTVINLSSCVKAERLPAGSEVGRVRSGRDGRS
jgi:hypothetical protein